MHRPMRPDGSREGGTTTAFRIPGAGCFDGLSDPGTHICRNMISFGVLIITLHVLFYSSGSILNTPPNVKMLVDTRGGGGGIGIGVEAKQNINITIIPIRTTTKPEEEATVKEVEWVRDEAWFENQVRRGCCPFAKTLYQGRYANVENRCCTSKVQQGEIDPLRAIGGVDYSPILSSKRNVTIFIQGDSLAEQHFLGMICYAWSANNLSVNLERLSAQKNQNHAQGTVWQAKITDNDSSFKIQYLRWDQPRYPSSARLGLAARETVDFNLFAKPDFIFLGGWHHGLSDKDSVEQFLAQMSVQGINGHGKQNVFVLDALPNHFPGGKYLESGKYPSNNDGLCTRNNSKGDPDINENLISIMEGQANVKLLQISKLYYHRGNAHVGHIPEGTVGPQGRDCLHWCIAAGVMDALTRMTLAAIYKNI